DPNDRFQSAGEFSKTLSEGAAESEVPLATPATVPNAPVAAAVEDDLDEETIVSPRQSADEVTVVQPHRDSAPLGHPTPTSPVAGVKPGGILPPAARPVVGVFLILCFLSRWSGEA